MEDGEPIEIESGYEHAVCACELRLLFHPTHRHTHAHTHIRMCAQKHTQHTHMRTHTHRSTAKTRPCVAQVEGSDKFTLVPMDPEEALRIMQARLQQQQQQQQQGPEQQGPEQQQQQQQQQPPLAHAAAQPLDAEMVEAAELTEGAEGNLNEWRGALDKDLRADARVASLKLMRRLSAVSDVAGRSSVADGVLQVRCTWAEG